MRQRFTFYGFRYVKLTQWTGDVKLERFRGIVLYSDMPQTGFIETGNDKVNRLFENTLWGQRGNYLDVPTDCPQRDERMGWTGDAQVFFGTAAFNMDVAAFFEKFLYDLGREQAALNGWVPVVIPKHDVHQVGACAWGDAATIIPWNLYVRYGDLTLLETHYPIMKAWVDAIHTHDEQTGATRLWKGSFHYGDWLSLDVEDPVGYRFGGTERTFLATCFYYYSATLLVKAARVLDKAEDAEAYRKLADAVQKAFLNEYMTESGRLAETTQTAYVLTLFIDILPEQYRAQAAYALRLKLKASNYHLRTGFIGTPYLCRVLSATGSNDIAYTTSFTGGFPKLAVRGEYGRDHHLGALEFHSPGRQHFRYGHEFPQPLFLRFHRGMDVPRRLRYSARGGRAGLPPFPAGTQAGSLAGLCPRHLYLSPAGPIESEWRYEDDKLEYRFAVPFGASR